MNRNNKIAIRILIISIGILIICNIISELDVRYNILRSDKNDIIGNVIFYTIILFIYISAFTITFLLYSFIKAMWTKITGNVSKREF